jgi:hypothetical protein
MKYVRLLTSPSRLLPTQRASTLITRMYTPAVVPDGLPAAVAPEDFLTLLCDTCEPPAFTSAARERSASIAAAAGAVDTAVGAAV